MFESTKELINELSKLIEITPKIDKAIRFATRMHSEQYRHDKTPYANHPIRVAINLLKYKKSKEIEDLVCAALLHDTLEDTVLNYYDIAEFFGEFVANIVKDVTNNYDYINEIGKEKYLSIKLKSMTSYELVIKLCDRLDNIMDLKNSSPEFIERTIKETINIIDYVAKNRLSITDTQNKIIEEIIRIIEEYDKTNVYCDKIENIRRNLKVKIENQNILNRIK